MQEPTVNINFHMYMKYIKSRMIYLSHRKKKHDEMARLEDDDVVSNAISRQIHDQWKTERDQYQYLTQYLEHYPEEAAQMNFTVNAESFFRSIAENQSHDAGNLP